MRDEWFIRGETPMTKSEVRAVSLSKLELDRCSVLWDIGSGTGSVSVEAALCHPIKQVYAFEKQPEAIELIKRNRDKAGLLEEKLVIIEGTAPDCFQEVVKTRPSHAFIGGSSGNLEKLIDRLLQINPEIRIVINAIALETVSEVIRILKQNQIEGEIVLVQASRARTAGAYHLMQGQNPVYIISFGGVDGKEDSQATVCSA